MLTISGKAGKVYGTTLVTDHGHVQQGDQYSNIRSLTKIEHHYHGLSAQAAPALSSRQNGRGYALLALSGELQDVVYNLVLLKEFLKKVRDLQRSKERIKPCEYFDMIAGAGWGGLAAVMLGSLQLSLEDTIFILTDIHETLEEVRDEQLPDARIKVLNILVDKIQNLVARRSCNVNQHFYNTHALACNVYLDLADHNDGSRFEFRSYDMTANQSMTLSEVISTIVKRAWCSSTAHASQDIQRSHPRASTPGLSLQAQMWHEAQNLLVDEEQDLHKHLDLLVSACSNSTGQTRAASPAVPKGTSDIGASFGWLKSRNRFCDLVELRSLVQSSSADQASDLTSLLSELSATINLSLQVAPWPTILKHTALHRNSPGFAIVKYAAESASLIEHNGSSRKSLADQVSDYQPEAVLWQLTSARMKGTATWMFKERRFERWATYKDRAILLCSGVLGCGKSIMAASIIDHLTDIENFCSSSVHYFFNELTGSHLKCEAAIRGLLKQLLSPNFYRPSPLTEETLDDAKKLFAISYRRPSHDELAELLASILQQSPDTLVVIDGFDCLPEDEIQNLFAVIRGAFGPNLQHNSKLALFSREHLGRGIYGKKQLQNVKHVHTIRIELDHVQKDIETLVDVSVDERQLRRQITFDDELVQHIKDTLKANGERMFLWIKLQLNTLWDPNASMTDGEIRDLLSNLPTDLNEVYGHCLNRIKILGRIDIANKVLRWMLYARQPLTIQQAKEAVILTPDTLEFTTSQVMSCSVTEYCGNLITTDATNTYVQFAHSSVKLYLQSLSEHPEADLYSERIVTDTCLAYAKLILSRKQIVVQTKTEIPGNPSHTILKTVPGGSAVLSFGNLFSRKTKHRNITVPLPSPKVTAVFSRTAIHDYIIRHWLWHTKQLKSPRDHQLFYEICLSGDTTLMPWLPERVTPYALAQKLAYHAVYEAHLPLLEVAKTSAGWYTFELLRMGKQPVTSIPLTHLAAALGDVSIIQSLRYLDWSAFDEGGYTALAWALRNGHLSAVVYLCSSPSDSPLSESPYSSMSCYCIRGFLPYGFTLNWLAALACLSREPMRSRMFHDTYSDIAAPFTSSTTIRSTWAAAFYATSRSGIREASAWLCALGIRRPFISPYVWSHAGWRLDSDRIVPITGTEADANYLELLLGCGIDTAELKSLMRWQAAALLRLIGPSGTHRNLYAALSRQFPAPTDKRSELSGRENDARFLHSPKDGDCWTFLSSRHSSRALAAHLQCRSTNFNNPNDLPRQHTAEHEAVYEALWAPSAEGKLPLDHALSTNNDNIIDILFCAMQLHQDTARMVELSSYTAVKLSERLIHASKIYEVHHQGCEFESRLQIERMDRQRGFECLGPLCPPDYVALRCLRLCQGDEAKSIQLYRSMKQDNFNGDFSLGTARSYWRIGPRYMLKPSIIGALYRWNWRLRRRRGFDLSKADLAYLYAVPEVLLSFRPKQISGLLLLRDLPQEHRLLAFTLRQHTLAPRLARLSEFSWCILCSLKRTREMLGQSYCQKNSDDYLLKFSHDGPVSKWRNRRLEDLYYHDLESQRLI